jgi:hypothetical protein
VSRDHDRRIDGDLRAEALAQIAIKPGFAGLGGEDRVLEHRLVELEADLADVARLLVAEQVAGAADVEIVAGELEARAEAVEVASTLSRFSATSVSAASAGVVR